MPPPLPLAAPHRRARPVPVEVAHERRPRLAVAVEIVPHPARREHGLVGAELGHDPRADVAQCLGGGRGGALVVVVVVVALEQRDGLLPLADGLAQVLGRRGLRVARVQRLLLLERVHRVPEAEAQRREEVPDGAALADVGLAALPRLDDLPPVGHVAQIAGPLARVPRRRPEHAVLGEVLGHGPLDDAVACGI